MKSHRYFEQLLAVYRDLSEAEHQELTQHLPRCPQCAARLAEYQTLDQTLLQLARPRPKRQLRQDFYAAVTQPTTPLGWLRAGVGYLTSLATPIVQVGAVALLVFVLWIVFRGQRDPLLTTTSPEIIAPILEQPTDLYYLPPDKSNLTDDINRVVVARFTATHPQFNLILARPDTRPIDRILTASAPEVVAWQVDNRTPLLVEQNLLQDISGLWQSEGWAEHYPPAFQTIGQVGEKHYLLPTAYRWFAIYYHRPTFEGYQLTPPQTWEEFLAVCATLKQVGVTPIIHPNPQAWPALIWFNYLDMRLNGPEFHHRLITGQAQFDTPPVKRVFETWHLLLEQEYFAENLAFRDLTEAARFMGQGRAAMILSTPDLQNALPEAEQADFGFFRFPIIDPALPTGENVMVESYLIPANAPHPEAAEAFLAYLGSAQTQIYLSETFGPRLNRVPLHSEVDPRLLTPQVQQGRTLVQTADEIIPYTYNTDDYSVDVVDHLEEALNKFLTNPNNIDTILVAAEELRRATTEKR
jgi:multiple sugar transport system substrate-binding protein/raffinose/stachyose/melibiose transport system substrate-binding protein